MKNMENFVCQLNPLLLAHSQNIWRKDRREIHKILLFKEKFTVEMVWLVVWQDKNYTWNVFTIEYIEKVKHSIFSNILMLMHFMQWILWLLVTIYLVYLQT